jgi:hypothetical protein
LRQYRRAARYGANVLSVSRAPRGARRTVLEWAARDYNRAAHNPPEGETTVIDVARPELTPEVLMATVWDAVKEAPGVVIDDVAESPGAE